AHSGESGEAAVNAIRAQLPTPIIDWAGPITYTALQAMYDALYPAGLQWYWRGDYVRELPDEAIAAHLDNAAKAGILSAMHLYPIDGVVRRRGPGDTAWSTRDATWSMVIAGIDADPSNAPAIKQWAQDYWKSVHPFNLAGAYPNFMMDDEGDVRIRDSFGPNYDRLAGVKATYDPQNLFRVNHNIPPAAH
ncbi:MAG: oxidoreductase, partial [Hyphomicrobiales bacterium]